MIEVRGRVVDPARPARRGGGRADRLPRPGDRAGPRGDQRAGRPVPPAGPALAAQLRAASSGRHVPLGRRLGPGVRARLGLGRARARRPGRDDDPAGGGRPADRGPDRRPGGPARRRRRVKVERIWFAREGDLSAWLDRARDGGVRGPWQGLDQLPATIDATTGPDGRFRLAGIGRDRIAELLVSGADDRHGPALRREPRRAGDPRPTDHRGDDDRPVPDDLPRPPVRVRRRADQADRGRRSATRTPAGPSPGSAPRHGLRREQPRPGPGRRGDDRRPGALSPHRPAQGAGLSPVPRAGQGPALHQGDLPDRGRLARAGAGRPSTSRSSGASWSAAG